MTDSLVLNNEDLVNLIKEQINHTNITIKVKGTSMRPFFRDGLTKITLEKKQKIKKYDVILFSYHGRYLLHRIIKIKDTNITVQGDGLTSKELIKEEDIIALVKFHELKQKIVFKDNKWYLFKVKLWRFLRPFRRLMLKLVKR